MTALGVLLHGPKNENGIFTFKTGGIMITEMAAFAGRLFEDLLRVEYIRWIVAKWTDMPFILNFLKPVNLKIFSSTIWLFITTLRCGVKCI